MLSFQRLDVRLQRASLSRITPGVPEADRETAPWPYFSWRCSSSAAYTHTSGPLSASGTSFGK